MKTIEDLQNDIKKIYDIEKNYVIEIGVISELSKNDRKNDDKGVTNAELMFIHENGSPLRSIPARPVLHITIEDALYYDDKISIKKAVNKAIDKFIKAGFDEKAFEDEMNRYCIRLQNHARNIIYDNNGILTSNALSTIKAKGYDHPLFNTGQLARSITCRLVKIK